MENRHGDDSSEGVSSTWAGTPTGGAAVTVHQAKKKRKTNVNAEQWAAEARDTMRSADRGRFDALPDPDSYFASIGQEAQARESQRRDELDATIPVDADSADRINTHADNAFTAEDETRQEFIDPLYGKDDDPDDLEFDDYEALPSVVQEWQRLFVDLDTLDAPKNDQGVPGGDLIMETAHHTAINMSCGGAAVPWEWMPQMVEDLARALGVTVAEAYILADGAGPADKWWPAWPQLQEVEKETIAEGGVCRTSSVQDDGRTVWVWDEHQIEDASLEWNLAQRDRPMPTRFFPQENIEEWIRVHAPLWLEGWQFTHPRAASQSKWPHPLPKITDADANNDEVSLAQTAYMFGSGRLGDVTLTAWKPYLPAPFSDFRGDPFPSVGRHQPGTSIV